MMTNLIFLFSLVLFCLSESVDIGSFQVQVENGILKGIYPKSSEDNFLNLSSLTLEGISPEAFDNVIHITSLELSFERNIALLLPPTVFSKLTNLEQVKFQNVNYLSVESHQFSKSKKLKLLELHEVPLIGFSSDALDGLSDDFTLKIVKFSQPLQPRIFGVNESVQIGHRDFRSLYNCSTKFPKYKKESEGILEASVIHNLNYRLHNNPVKLCILDGAVEQIGFELTDGNCKVIKFQYQYMFLVNKGIKSFKKDWYRVSHNFTVELMIENNAIEEIDGNVLNDLPQTVRIVSLIFNHIKAIKNNVIANNEIYKLDLGYNNIEVIENNAFKEMKSLRELFLKTNKISDLSFIASLSSTLLRLNLKGNKISNIPNNIFSNLKNLYSLYLESNDIKVISGEPFAGLAKLSVLSLNDNEIDKVEKGPYNDLLCMQTLTFRHNKITTIEKGFAKNMNNLENLDLDCICNDMKFESGTFYGLPADSSIHRLCSSNNSVLPYPTYTIEAGVYRNSTDVQ